MKKVCFILVVLIAIGGCHEDKICKNTSFSILPFIEKYYTFTCGGNLYEYEYIKRKKAEIDSLTDCTFSPPVAFPLDEANMVYIMVGKMSYYYKDTFQSIILKDTCNKTLVYDLQMIQRTTILESNGGGVKSMFCSVENIPEDYEVEVKYKYVPLE